MKIYQTGDVCPCCGQIITTEDPYRLRLISFLADFLMPPSTVDIVRRAAEREVDGEDG